MPTTTESSNPSSRTCPTGTSPDYGEAYFTSGNYKDYLERAPRYARMAAELAGFLRSVGLLDGSPFIVDFGCGVGLLTEALRRLDCNAAGFDTSQWAGARAKSRGVPMLDQLRACDGLIALDVFEHMTDDAILAALKAANPDFMVVRIPVASSPGGDFHLAVSRSDPTHTNCKTAVEWNCFFSDAGFRSLRLSLYTIYDSAGVYCALLI